jgi:hypothetical protein
VTVMVMAGKMRGDVGLRSGMEHSGMALMMGALGGLDACVETSSGKIRGLLVGC